jgi:hypothetical protein
MQKPSRWVGLLTFATGLLNLFAGLAIAGVGFGFANCSACGSGMGFAFVGLWMSGACARVARNRPLTLAALGCAWLWLLVRVGVDLPAIGAAVVLFLFLLPAISLPLGLSWVLLSFAWVIILATRLFRAWRGGGLNDLTRRAGCGAGVMVALLVGITLIMPELGWLARGKQIAGLRAHYSNAVPHGAAAPMLGACSMNFLGYSLTQHGSGTNRDPVRQSRAYELALGDAVAELASAKAAGARYFRLGASGDHLLVDKPRQEEIDDRLVAAVRAAGLPLVLVDTQHPDICKQRKLNWAEFCRFQRHRIRYYSERYHPEVYFVVCEPMSYHGFALRPETKYSAADWAEQLSEMCRLVKSTRGETQTGICLLVMKEKEPEWEVWTRMRDLPELDLLSVEVYQPQDFASAEARLRQYGHPREFGKRFWIAETYNGWAMNGNRRWDQDAEWLRVVLDYARVVDAEAALVWTFGSFVPNGSFWDFGNGRLQAKWGNGSRLSIVGQTFRELASH